MRKIVVLRGIPGTGKTTWGLKYYDKRKKKCPYEDIRYMSRDAYRQRITKYDENEYQKSIADKHWDKSIRKNFWRNFGEIMDSCDLMILDMTMVDYRDIIALQWYLFEYQLEKEVEVKIRWYIFITEYGSKHNVPPEKMEIYVEQFEDTTDLIGEPWLFWSSGELKEMNEKWAYIS